jgi:hypothetical protein
MHLAWINRAPSYSIVQSPPEMTFAAHAHSSTAPSPTGKQRRYCVFCDKNNHSSEKCHHYRIDRSGGVVTLVKLERKGHSSGLATDKPSHSSFAAPISRSAKPQRIVVVDTGSTINILRHRDLFNSINPCEERWEVKCESR